MLYLEGVAYTAFRDVNGVTRTIGMAAPKTPPVELYRSYAELDELVRERTAELERVNAQLRAKVIEDKQTQEALRQAEERFRTVADFTYDWEYWQAPDHKCLYVSPSCERITGYGPEEFLSDAGLLEKIVHPDDQARFLSHIHHSFHDAQAASIEFRIVTRTGEERWVGHCCQPVHSSDGRWLGRRISNRDISDRMRAEETNRALVENMARLEKIAILGTLAAAVAHEINNPLQAIQSHLELVLDFALPAEKQREFLGVVQKEILRLNEIVQRVLQFARPADPPRCRVALAELIHRALSLANKRLQQGRIQVRTDVPKELYVLAGPDHLVQVFLNLVLNACEAIVTDGYIGIVAYAEGDQAVISLANSGCSISVEDLPHLFEPFFTTKPGGTGLGLAVSRTLLDQYGGSLSAENRSTEPGVVFTVRLPLAGPAAPVEPAD
jgi:PAS domain S-box-containing protein